MPKFHVITVSDSRYKTKKKDISGEEICKLIQKQNWVVDTYEILPDNAEMLRKAIISSTADIIITTGGTGITDRDITVETVKKLLKKEITGFGELFRYLSYKKIGTKCMLSRAIAGALDNGIFIFSLPGSPASVKLAMEEIIVKEVPHILSHGGEQ